MKRQKRSIRSIISAVLVLALCAGMGMTVNAATVDGAQKKADELESKKKSAQAEQNSLKTQLNDIVADMKDAQDKLDKKQKDIKAAEDELVKAKIDENNRYESMKMRIKYMYENGNSQLIEILIDSDSIADLLNKAEYFSQISTYDREKLTELQQVVQDVQVREDALQNEYTALSNLQNELIQKQDAVQTLLDNNKLQVSNLEKQIGDNAATLQKLVEEAEAERQKQLQQQAAQQAQATLAVEQQAVEQQAADTGSNYTQPSSTPVVSGGGQFTNPCPGATISSTFGYRDFDGSFHKGLDLAAGEGTPTYAAADGYVVIAGWSDSAGNWVVINHGNGLTTKYMHHSALCVSAGQTVVKGQQIGYVGNTGDSFGAHLHFQVEVNDQAVDPLGYL